MTQDTRPGQSSLTIAFRKINKKAALGGDEAVESKEKSLAGKFKDGLLRHKLGTWPDACACKLKNNPVHLAVPKGVPSERQVRDGISSSPRRE
ncbi:hypothetical protein CcaverHIS631_0500120 [Cutaneotrichosporon cavernicola]|nr:hypothetical protein CcaverHIS631_0500120 [Cutaneotrichosporon cavernicola]